MNKLASVFLVTCALTSAAATQVPKNDILTGLLSPAEVQEVQERMPLPQALKLIYPPAQRPQRPTTLSSLEGDASDSSDQALQYLRRRLFLKRLLRRKRQRTKSVSDELEQQHSKRRLPVTEYASRSKGGNSDRVTQPRYPALRFPHFSEPTVSPVPRSTVTTTTTTTTTTATPSPRRPPVVAYPGLEVTSQDHVRRIQEMLNSLVAKKNQLEKKPSEESLEQSYVNEVIEDDYEHDKILGDKEVFEDDYEHDKILGDKEVIEDDYERYIGNDKALERDKILDEGELPDSEEVLEEALDKEEALDNDEVLTKDDTLDNDDNPYERLDANENDEVFLAEEFFDDVIEDSPRDLTYTNGDHGEITVQDYDQYEDSDISIRDETSEEALEHRDEDEIFTDVEEDVIEDEQVPRSIYEDEFLLKQEIRTMLRAALCQALMEHGLYGISFCQSQVNQSPSTFSPSPRPFFYPGPYHQYYSYQFPPMHKPYEARQSLYGQPGAHHWNSYRFPAEAHRPAVPGNPYQTSSSWPGQQHLGPAQ